jgi:N-acetylmuramoyl-L-alanine amidase
MLHHLQQAACAAALVLLCTCTAFAAAGQNRLTDIRYWSSPTYTRLVLDLKAEAAWEAHELKDANRIVVELDGFDGFLPKDLLEINDPIIKKARVLQTGGKVRILIELQKPAEHKIFALKRLDEKPPRLVIDVTRADLEQAARVQREETRKRKKKGDYIVVIDPGHGGEDPGAVSPNGMYEKTLVLSIGRQLAAKLAGKPGIKAYMTRRGDYFIPLGKRVEIAKEYGADLFLSVHVNAGFSSKAAGSSVYCLSFKGASNNVARVAEERENASDSIGGVPLEQQRSNLNVILCDLVQTHTINSSVQLAGLLLEDVGKFNKLYLSTPQEANFAVLRAPDIPSVLIETDFISSPDREKMLESRDFQKRFTETVAGTVAAYLAARPVPSAPPAVSAPKSQDASPPSRPADRSRPAGGAAAEQQAPAAKPSQEPPLQAPPGGKYRIVKKSDTEYALVPVDGYQALPGQPAGVQAGPSTKSDPAPSMPQQAKAAKQAAPQPQAGVQSEQSAKSEPAAPAQQEKKAKLQSAPNPQTRVRPVSPEPAGAVIWHVVKKGENLSSIAQKYRIPLKELCRQNGLAITTKVEAGVKLKIKKQKTLQR